MTPRKGVISIVARIITEIITLVITTHEPPSNLTLRALGAGCSNFLDSNLADVPLAYHSLGAGPMFQGSYPTNSQVWGP